jgi:Ras-related protein Rab-21
MTEKTSFLKLKDWVTELQTVLGNDLLIAVACNKCDLSSRREVSMEQAQEFAASLGATLFETSAKTNQGVEELFLDLSAKLLQRSEGDCLLASAAPPNISSPPPPSLFSVAEKQGAARVAVAEPAQGTKKDGCC